MEGEGKREEGERGGERGGREREIERAPRAPGDQPVQITPDQPLIIPKERAVAPNLVGEYIFSVNSNEQPGIDNTQKKKIINK